MQRCAVRVTYLNNKTRGQWNAHGRYLARESATHENPVEGVGFGHGEQAIDIEARLENWQRAGDERMWKLIISPEYGDLTDLRRLTGDLMERMERTSVPTSNGLRSNITILNIPMFTSWSGVSEPMAPACA